jgi:hypothetical protein
MAAERIIVQEGIRAYLLDGTLQELFRLDNLVLLHCNCHRQVHSRDNSLPLRVFHRAFEGLELNEARARSARSRSRFLHITLSC